MQTLSHSLVRAFRDAAAIAVVAGAVGAAFNAARPSGIPFVRREPYQILVPCPDLAGETQAMPSTDPRLKEAGTLVVDARPAAEFERWRLPGARHVPFDFLEPIERVALEAIASSGAARVVVYGDGGDPDTGRELARELAGKGIRNVFYVEGGAPALRGGTP